MNRANKSRGEPRHVRLYEWLLACPAWRSLDVYERSLYVEFKARYTGVNNGNIAFSGQDMATALNCSNRPADRALRTLIDRGFIKVAKAGHFDWKSRGEGGARATTYTLTEYPVDFPNKVLSGATKDFMKWRAPAVEKKTRGDESTRMGGRRHPIPKPMGGRRHPNGVSTSPEKGQNDHLNGVTTSPAYSLPQREAAERPAAHPGSSPSREEGAHDEAA